MSQPLINESAVASQETLDHIFFPTSMRAKQVTWARLPPTKPAACSTHQLTMPMFCTCVQAIHPKSVQCVRIHIIPVQCSIVVAVVVMVVSQVTAQSSKKKKRKNSVTRANHAHRFLLAKRAWQTTRVPFAFLPYHSTPCGGQLSTRQAAATRLC